MEVFLVPGLDIILFSIVKVSLRLWFTIKDCYSPWPAGVDMGVDVLVIVITGVQAGLLFVAGQVGGVVIDTQKVVGT